jgi:hypothetical protein
MRSLAVKEAAAGHGVCWAFAAGTIIKAPPGSVPYQGGPGRGGPGRGGAGGRGGAHGPTDIQDVYCELPSLLVGRIIGKGGATIKEITARSHARVSVDAGPNVASVLHCAGRPEALESARMLINNALTAPRPGR